MKVHVRHGLATVTRRSVQLLLSRERRSPTCAVTEAARRVSAAWEERPAHASAKWLELREDLLGPRWRLYGQTKPVEESCQQEAFTTSILRSRTSSDRSRSTSTYSGRSDGPRRSGIRPTEARRRSFTSCDKKPAMVVSACVQPTVARTATTTSASNTSPSRLTDEGRLMKRTHAAWQVAQTFISRPRRIATSLATTRSSPSTRTGCGWKCSAGPVRRRWPSGFGLSGRPALAEGSEAV